MCASCKQLSVSCVEADVWPYCSLPTSTRVLLTRSTRLPPACKRAAIPWLRVHVMADVHRHTVRKRHLLQFHYTALLRAKTIKANRVQMSELVLPTLQCRPYSHPYPYNFLMTAKATVMNYQDGGCGSGATVGQRGGGEGVQTPGLGATV